MQKLGRALLFASSAAAMEILPPLTLHIAGRSLILLGQALRSLGDGVEGLGEETLRYAERQRFRNAQILRQTLRTVDAAAPAAAP